MAPDSDGIRTHPLTGAVQGALWAAAASAGLVGSLASGEGVLGVLIGIAAGLMLGMGFGFLSWWFTRYTIDGTELRINSGFITKRSRRMPYERLQSVDIAEPLVARIFGLAELRIEMAGGKDSRTTLRFLKLANARDLRTVLLNRAHGLEADETQAEAPRDVIASVPPERIMIGTLLGLDFMFSALGTLALIVAGLWFHAFVVVLGGVIPLGSWLMQIIALRVFQQWGFALTRGSGGLRIERGLLSRTSQTIPVDRVQGIAIEEPFVWRRLGWQRLEVDVAGYANQSDNSGVNANSTLLPIADPPLATHVIGELLPGANPHTVALTSVPKRGWWFAPIGWKYRSAGADNLIFVSQTGWLERTTSIVPHHKTQSVALRQGPLQRMRRVATVEVHSPKGPVNAEGRHLDEGDAHRETYAQLDRARAARAR
ncbi:MAG: PH domain-containing protein [Aeromicrobium sp.]